MHRNVISVSRTIGLAAAAVMLTLAAGPSKALAQDNVYSLSYYANAHTPGAPDATLRLVNDGFNGDSSPGGDLCASTYVFDNAEELIECCSCYVTPNGLLTLSVNTNLTHNPLTGKAPTRGVIKVISSGEAIVAGCDPTIVNTSVGIHGWITHIQRAGAGFSQTEEELADASLVLPCSVATRFVSSSELFDLAEDCKVLTELGSGQGKCDCTDAKR